MPLAKHTIGAKIFGAFAAMSVVIGLTGLVGYGILSAAGDIAVTTFDGPPLDLDRAYGAVGRWVVDQATSSAGPVRERYTPTGDEDDLLAHTTEVCWPV